MPLPQSCLPRPGPAVEQLPHRPRGKVPSRLRQLSGPWQPCLSAPANVAEQAGTSQGLGSFSSFSVEGKMSVAGPGPDRSLPLPNSAAGGRVLNLREPRLLRLAEIAVVTPASACVLKGWGGGLGMPPGALARGSHLIPVAALGGGDSTGEHSSPAPPGQKPGQMGGIRAQL